MKKRRGRPPEPGGGLVVSSQADTLDGRYKVVATEAGKKNYITSAGRIPRANRGEADDNDDSRQYRAIMESRMRECLLASMNARNAIPRAINPLNFVLTMPNLLRHLEAITKMIVRTKLQMGMFYLKQIATFRRLRRQHSIKKIQVSWKEAIVRRSAKKRSSQEDEEKRKQVERAVRLIQINLFKRLFNMRVHRRGKKKRESKAVCIQRLFRGFIVRCQQIDELRKSLVQILRKWAQGYTDKLLSNQCKYFMLLVLGLFCPHVKCIDLRDLQSKYLVTTAITTSMTSSHPYRNLPPKRVLKSLISKVLEKQAELGKVFAVEQDEHKKMLKERHDLMHEEHRSVLYERYLRCCERRQREKLIEEKLKIQREKMEYVKRIKRKAELVKNLGAEQLVLLEKKEREKMFREDYTIRRYYDRLAALRRKTIETDWECMKHEDVVGRELRKQETDAADWVMLMGDQVVRAAEAHARDLSHVPRDQGGSSPSQLPAESKLVLTDGPKGLSHIKAAATDQDWEGPSPPGNTISKWREATFRNHFKTWDDRVDFRVLERLSSRPNKFGHRFECNLRELQIPGNANNLDHIKNSYGLVALEAHMEQLNVNRFISLMNLRHAARVGAIAINRLTYNRHLFVIYLKKLCKLRTDLRTNKLTTRMQRQKFLSEAAELEISLTRMQKELEDSLTVVPQLLRKEVVLFAGLFVDVGGDPGLYTHQDSLTPARGQPLEEKNTQETNAKGRKGNKWGGHHSSLGRNAAHSKTFTVADAPKSYDCSENRGKHLDASVSMNIFGKHSTSSISNAIPLKGSASLDIFSLANDSRDVAKTEFWGELKAVLRGTLPCPPLPPSLPSDIQGTRSVDPTAANTGRSGVSDLASASFVTSMPAMVGGTENSLSPKQRGLKKIKTGSKHYMTSKASKNASSELRSHGAVDGGVKTNDSDEYTVAAEGMEKRGLKLAVKPVIPGLHLFTLGNANEYDFFISTEHMWDWALIVRDWINEVEFAWKEAHKTQIISFIQKLYYLLGKVTKHSGGAFVLLYFYDYIYLLIVFYSEAQRDYAVRN
jgi:hypothetical protein